MTPPPQKQIAGPSASRATLLFPEKIPAERWIAAGLFVLACLYLCAFRRFMLLDPDEGIVLQGAERILRGEVLYRDFFSFLTPGSYYLLALLFGLFGNSLMVARSTLVFYGGVFTVFAYWMARRVSSRWAALLIAYLTLATSLSWRFVVLHNWDSTFCGCVLRSIVRSCWRRRGKRDGRSEQERSARSRSFSSSPRARDSYSGCFLDSSCSPGSNVGSNAAGPMAGPNTPCGSRGRTLSLLPPALFGRWHSRSCISPDITQRAPCLKIGAGRSITIR